MSSISKKQWRIFRTHLVAHILLIIISALFLLPIIYTMSVALSPSNSLISAQFLLIPQGATLDNFKTILFDKPFFLWFRNSLLLSLLTVVFALSVCIPAAYAYSRWSFPGKNGSLFLLLLLNAFPAILSMVAIYKLFRTFNLLNTFTGLVLVYSGAMIVFGIWNMKGYFDTISRTYEEAAMIDGAGNLRMLFSIILPLAKPAIIVTGMLVFILTWNEYIYAVTFLKDSQKLTLAAGLYSLQGTNYTTNWPLFAAGALLVTLPVLIVFFLVQRHMASGLAAGGAKY